MPNQIKRNCSQANFKALMVAQCLDAFNDNLLKTLVSLLAVGILSEPEQRVVFLSLAGGLFILPYILFSASAGFAADRYSKTVIARWTKVVELVAVSVASVLLYYQNLWGLLVTLFILGLHSTFLSPAKYGLLPELLEADHLSRGNGYLQFWSLLGILFGTASAGLLLHYSRFYWFLPALVMCSLALVGLLATFRMTVIPAARSEGKWPLNPFGPVIRTWAEIRKVRPLFLTLLAIAYFWYVGAFFQLSVFVYAKDALALSEIGSASLVTCLALGTGLGSVLAGKISEGKVELGLVPLGAAGLSIGSMLLMFTQPGIAISFVVLFLVGLSAGLYVVPLCAFFQKGSPPDRLGEYLASLNVLAMLGVLGASASLWLLHNLLQLNAGQGFFVVGVVSLVFATYIFNLMPEALVRCVNWIFTHSVYRLNVIGRSNVPLKGGALLVSNHVSFVDPGLILASLERPVRFLMYRPLFELPLVGWAGRIMKAIPVSGSDAKETTQKALQQAREFIEAGELVGIFAEGGITRSGEILPFKSGLERIMADSTKPIIPVCLDELWGSIFSHAGGRFFWKWPKKIPYPVTISFGEPLPPSASAQEVREAVLKLSNNMNNTDKENYIVTVQGV